jgi:hypothetical protein
VVIGFVSGILSVRSTEVGIASWQIGDVAPPTLGKVAAEMEPEVGVVVPYVQVLGTLPEREAVNLFDVRRIENTERPRKTKRSRKMNPTFIEQGGLSVKPILPPRAVPYSVAPTLKPLGPKR